MKTIFKFLFVDEDLVKNIKTTKLNEGLLYNHLFSGKITLQEYLLVTKA